MHNTSRISVAALAILSASGCAGSGGWMGADAEKSYDAALDARRLAGEINNDDYYEIHQDGRIYVLADLADFRSFVATGEIPLAVTKIGAGPKGETLKMALGKKEAKAMEKLVGFKGAAQKLYEGDLAGAGNGFYGEIHDDATIYVFGDWSSLSAYRRTGVASGVTPPGAGPAGEKVVYVIAASADPAPLQSKFKAVHASQ